MWTITRTWALPPLLVLCALPLVSCGVPVSGAAGSQPNAAAGPADLFSFTSDQNDPVGEGQSKSLTPPTARFVVEPGTQRDYLQLVVQRAAEYWSIDIAAPTGHTLQMGTYENAVEPALRTDHTAGLMVYGEGRACNRIYGSFSIRQIVFDQEGRLLGLQATFVQRCEAADGGAFRGTLHYGRIDAAP